MNVRACTAVCASLLLSGLGCASGPEPAPESRWEDSPLQPGRVAPETQGERELLARLSDLSAEQPVRIAGQVFVAGEPYHAASGRMCRSITVRDPNGSRGAHVKLACKGEHGWVFVPDVFGTGNRQDHATGQEPAPTGRSVSGGQEPPQAAAESASSRKWIRP